MARRAISSLHCQIESRIVAMGPTYPSIFSPGRRNAAAGTRPSSCRDDCAVFGIPDSEYGESICAVVKLEPGASLGEADIKAHVREHLAGFKVLKMITFHDSLPREDSGKMFKRKLRASYWEQAGRSL